MPFFRGVYNPYDVLPTMPSVSTFSIGDRVQTPTGDEGLVTRTDSRRSYVLVTSHYDYIHVKIIFNDHLKPVDPWREALVEGTVVELRIMRGWYHCHVDSVSEDTLVLNPVFTHALITVPRNTLRIKRTHLTFPRWTVRPYPTSVKCAETTYPCYGTTEHYYIVDTRAGRAYLPKNDCTPIVYSDPPAVSLGTLRDNTDIPACCLNQLHYETILDIMLQSRHNTCASGVNALLECTHAFHTYRHWSSTSIAFEVENAFRINDDVYMKELLDICSAYHIANRSQRLEQRLRARKLVSVTCNTDTAVEITLYWNGIAPRAATMLSARDLFLRLKSSPRRAIRLCDPYATPMEHAFLYPYQVATLKNMFTLEDTNTSELFTYGVNGHKCNDYTGVMSPTRWHGGGFLSADVGLGKTIMMCALMLARPMETLIVVPPTLLSHWQDKLKHYGLPFTLFHGKAIKAVATVRQVKDLSKLVKHGQISQRLINKLTELYAMDPRRITDDTLRRIRRRHKRCHRRAATACRRHCILTTPGIVRNHWAKFIFASRVVIDEAHQFKSTTTATVRYLHHICSHSMWCITATPQSPIQRAQLLNVFPGKLVQNMSHEDVQRVERVTLRLSRDKLEKMGAIRAITVQEETVLCDRPSLYENQWARVLAHIMAIPDSNKRQKRMLIGDMQRMCIHTSCLPLYKYGTRVDVDTATFDNISHMFKFNDKDRVRVMQTIASLDTCAICLEQYERPTITSCGHVYCRDCVAKLKQHTVNCPQCRQPVTQYIELVDTVDSVNRVTHLGQVYRVPEIPPEEGSKVKCIENILKKGPAVICSKHTSVVRYLAKRLDLPAITGKTTQVGRVKALQMFEEQGALLITEKSAGVGLCLQRAHHLIFVEPNMKNKSQVVGRIKRLGQTKNIKLWTLVYKNTVDDNDYEEILL